MELNDPDHDLVLVLPQEVLRRVQDRQQRVSRHPLSLEVRLALERGVERHKIQYSVRVFLHLHRNYVFEDRVQLVLVEGDQFALHDAEPIIDGVFLRPLFFQFTGKNFQGLQLVLDRTFINIAFESLLKLIGVRICLCEGIHPALSQFLRDDLTLIVV